MSNEHDTASASFRDFEHAGWAANVADYEAAYARVTRQAIEPMLDAVALGPGERLLDVATGPGYVAAAALARDARVTGLDFSAPMIERARAAHPAAVFDVGDAEALPYPAASFDAVVMNFGLLHLARPERALAEAARVLVPGGRIAFTVWDRPAHTLGFAAILNAIQAHGNPNVALPPGPPFFRFGDPAECERVLREAGFAASRVVQVPQLWRFDAPEHLFEAIYSGGVRLRALLKAQTPAAFAAIRAATLDAARSFVGERGVEVPMPAVLATGTRPA